MDKYERFAVNHYFSDWPENMSFDEFFNTLYKHAGREDFEGITLHDDYTYFAWDYMVESVKRMVKRLRLMF